MLQLTLLVMGLGYGIGAWRLRSERGRERMAALDDEKLRRVFDLYVRGDGQVPALVAAMVPAFFGVLNLVVDRPLDAGAWALSSAALFFAIVQGRRVAPEVRQQTLARGVEPTPREVSDRRRRRTRQIGGAAAACYGTSAAIVTVVRESSPWAGFAAVLILASFVLLIAAAWAAVWRYGDERPDEAS